MGCGQSAEGDPVSLFLLGIGGTGKSTFSKQIIRLYAPDHFNAITSSYREIIKRNIINGFLDLFPLGDSDLIHPDVEPLVDYIKNFDISVFIFDTNTVVDAKIIKELWATEYIQNAFIESTFHQMQLTTMPYFIDNIKRICQEDYEPTPDDIFHARQRSTGLFEHQFTFEKTNFIMNDVGGQLPERAKWAGMLSQTEVAAIIYFVSLSDFNVQSEEENGKTQIEVSKGVWQSILKQRENRSIILFLNKFDLFEQKINGKKQFKMFKKQFPKYKGKADPLSCAEFVRDSFLKSVEDPDTVASHISCALDSNQMEVIFGQISEYCLSERMGIFGM